MVWAGPAPVAQDKSKLWFDLDLVIMEDEALIVLAKECEYAPARDELIVRYGGQTSRLIDWMAYRYRLSNADAEDARQNAVFWFVEAINKYDTNQIGKPRGCSFRSFIHRVVMARFKDFAKHVRRVDAHYDRKTRCGEDATSAAGIELTRNDPASLAEAHEAASRLQATVTSLDPDTRRLWQLLADGISLRQIAEKLGISYDAAKRRRRKLIAELKSQLSQETNGRPQSDSADEN
jgi:RNA polymerase sigma factor (sigma-70 family)